MGVIDVEQLLQEVSEEAPAGENFEYDPAFAEMTRAAEGKAERQMGDETIEAEPPDWDEVRGKALAILSRSRDLRVGVYLARALAHTDGMIGLADGLALLRGLLERYWDTVHPQLDPEDDNDPTMRVNVLVSLCDPAAMLGSVREAPLVSARGLGQFCLRDIEVATGVVPAPAGGEPPPEMGIIQGAFMESEVDDLQATADAVTQSVEHAQTIEAVLTERVGATQAPDLSALPELLTAAQKIFAEQLARRGLGMEGQAAVAAAPGEAAPQPIAGEIQSREDVVRMLDKACDYFERHEPSSPVPLLLRRAKRLISKDFMDILRDLAPDGVTQAENISGTGGES